MVELSKREAIIEVINRLFIYTDFQDWEKLLSEVFAAEVLFDMSSAGGPSATKLPPGKICDMWRDGFKGIDAIHHQAGNYLVRIFDDVNAEVTCYAVATHYKKSASKGNVREFVGSYNIGLVFTDQGWRINAFRYNLKYMNGNVDLN
jgi:hypothetical protein